LLLEAASRFPDAQAIGIEINSDYVDTLRSALVSDATLPNVTVLNENFFAIDWLSLKARLREPVLIVGNPPWVTNAAVGAIGGSNLPAKSNFQGHVGLDAVTGKSNFDISEWILRRLVDVFGSTRCTIAVLCKIAVARKVLAYAWSSDVGMTRTEIRRIDASAHFGASVDACLLLIETGCAIQRSCLVYDGLVDSVPSAELAFESGELIANLAFYERWRHLEGQSSPRWRSGVKHDAAKVMELRATSTGLMNGFDEPVDLEPDYLYPMLKTSDVARGDVLRCDRWMLVPQRSVGEDTSGIRLNAPRTWGYLNAHGDVLDARASSIYRKRARFSVFGVGQYTFAPWKVAISGLYKKIRFAVVGPLNERPVLFDDATYFLPCESELEAQLIAEVLNSEPATEFFTARVFWDAKRPITVDLLSKLNVYALADELGRGKEFRDIRRLAASETLQTALFPHSRAAG